MRRTLQWLQVIIFMNLWLILFYTIVFFLAKGKAPLGSDGYVVDSSLTHNTRTRVLNSIVENTANESAIFHPPSLDSARNSLPDHHGYLVLSPHPHRVPHPLRGPEEGVVGTRVGNGSQAVGDRSLMYGLDMRKEKANAIKGGPMHYLHNYKNPCWLSKISTTNPYPRSASTLSNSKKARTKNMFVLMTRYFRAKAQALKAGEALTRLRCLPLVYLVGVTKSGTTDLFEKILWHPDMTKGYSKEPMYWNVRRMAGSRRMQFSDYLDMYDFPSMRIDSEKNKTGYHAGMTIDGSPNYLWNYDGWPRVPGNKGMEEPRVVLPHTLRAVVPKAKVIVILREPASRSYSQFRMWSANLSSTVFHELMSHSVRHMSECLSQHSVRSCVYLHALHQEGQYTGYGRSFKNRGLYLRASMYHPFISDWLAVFPSDQVLVLRAEDYYSQRTNTLHQVYSFLGLSPLTEEQLRRIEKSKVANARESHKKRSLEPMLPNTERMLKTFFMPFNLRLSKLLNDTRFLWQDNE